MTQQTTSPPDEKLRTLAAKVRSELSRVYRSDKPLTLVVSEDDAHHQMVFPAEIMSLVLEILDATSQGQIVQVVGHDAMLTTQEAADFLRVSRPFLTKTIDAGELPCQMVGTHRRLKFVDVEAYKTKMDKGRDKALDDIVRFSEDLGLYD